MLSRLVDRLRWYKKRLKMACGIPLRMRLHFEDRVLLEEVILPHFAADDRFGRVLFVGCEEYTAHYRFRFSHRQYTTLELNPNNRAFGAWNHICDSVANVRNHFAPGSLDLIFMNGLIGWGLNDPVEADKAVQGCYECLSPGGVLMIGWDDTPAHRPFRPADLPALRQFAPYVFPPFGTAERCIPSEYCHTFNFYTRVGATELIPSPQPSPNAH